jgi:hypothetical protein
VANLIEQGAKWLACQLVANASYPARYNRAGDSVQLNVVQARSTRTLSDEQGGSRIVELEDDWLIRIEDLRLAGGITEPLLGDQIIVQSGPKAGTYELLQPGPTTKHAERINAGTMWRCHTKRLRGPNP